MEGGLQIICGFSTEWRVGALNPRVVHRPAVVVVTAGSQNTGECVNHEQDGSWILV